MEDVRTVKLFNQDIPIRIYGCKNKCFKPVYINPPRLNLFIQLTSKCNANCSFCEYHNNCIENKFNIKKLDTILKELVSNIYIGKINFTGGEPTINSKLFDDVANSIGNNINFSKKPEITVNTNGYDLDLVLKHQDLLDYIAISHHHYEDTKNKEIFKTDAIANSQDIKNFQKKLKEKKHTQLRCNLITGYIDSSDEIKKYLNYAISLGIKDCGFVTLMPLNQFCNEHQVDFNNLIDLKDDDFIKVNYWERLDNKFENSLCKCANFLFSNERGEICAFYSRLFCNANLTDGQLVFDGENLRLGFGGKIIY